MTKAINSIEAAKMEAAGTGAFSLSGRKIIFRSANLQFTWNCRTDKEAVQHLRMFRASVRLVA